MARIRKQGVTVLTESQNWLGRRDHSSSRGPASLFKGTHRGHLKIVKKTPHPPWKACSSAWSLHRKEVLPHVHVEFPGHQFQSVASCSIASHP